MASETYGYYGNTLPKYAPETVVRPQPLTETKKKTKARIVVTPKFFSRVYVCMALAVIFTVVFRYAMINDISRSNERLNAQLIQLFAHNEQQSVYLDMSTDLKTVEEIAHNKLNMGVPQAYQIVEVSVGMENKAVKAENHNNKFITSLKNVCSKVMEYLY